MPVTADFLVSELAKLHDEARGWMFFPEFRMGTGYGQNVECRLDAWAIQAWNQWRSIDGDFGKPARSCTVPNIRRAFEVKVSRSDAVSELRNPDKRWLAYAVSHEFYFVAPAGLIKRKELTKDDGLIEWTGERLHTIKAARVRETMPPRWSFVAALARRVLELEQRRLREATGVVPALRPATVIGPERGVGDSVDSDLAAGEPQAGCDGGR